MALKTKTPINILFANTKEINGKLFGQLVIELPKERDIQKEILDFLDEKKVTYWEVD